MLGSTNCFAPRITRRFLRIRVRSLLHSPIRPPLAPRPPSKERRLQRQADVAHEVPTPSTPPAHAHTQKPEATSGPLPKVEVPNVGIGSKSHSKPPIESPPPPGLSNYAYRWETIEPTHEELIRADEFFCRYPPKHLWSEAKFKKIDYGNAPEVAFLGRSNVGKSSLLNALMNHQGMAYTSSKPGKTKLLSAFAINQGKLVLMDMPGYGHASREDWGTQIMKYLSSRKQCRRAFVLIEASHGPKPTDLMLLEHLGREGISFQVILSKIDKLKRGDSTRRAFEDMRHILQTGIAGVAGLGEILGVAGNPAKKAPGGDRRIGISALRHTILQACGLDRTKW